jgi:hypothetical protein
MDTISRVCTFCLTRMPASALSADLSHCTDVAACHARADAKQLYPIADQDSIEQALAARVNAGGAVARS